MKIDRNKIVLSVFVIMEFPKYKTTVKFRDCLGLDHLKSQSCNGNTSHDINVAGQIDRKPFI